MSVAGIASHSFIPYSPQAPTNRQQIQQEFQQLGQDLQSGNVSAARADFTALQRLTQTSSTPGTQSGNSITQEFNQLAQDLKSGNLSAAQADYSQLQQSFQIGNEAHHSHHRHMGSSRASDINQLLQQLGQELQAGNLSTAQQTYMTLQQDTQPIQSSGVLSGPSPQTHAVSASA